MSNRVKNRTSTRLELCLAKICQRSLMSELKQTITCDKTRHIVF